MTAGVRKIGLKMIAVKNPRVVFQNEKARPCGGTEVACGDGTTSGTTVPGPGMYPQDR